MTRKPAHDPADMDSIAAVAKETDEHGQRLYLRWGVNERGHYTMLPDEPKVPFMLDTSPRGLDKLLDVLVKTTVPVHAPGGRDILSVNAQVHLILSVEEAMHMVRELIHLVGEVSQHNAKLVSKTTTPPINQESEP